MSVNEAIALASVIRLIQPITKDLYEGAKKIGASGLNRWEQKSSIQKIGRRIKAIEQVRTIWKPEGPISLREFFHPPKFLIDKKAVRITRINELSANAVVVQGIVGQGKSVMMRSLALEELLSNDAKWLPVFLELKDLTPKIGLIQAIFRQLDSYDIDVDDITLDYMFRSGKVALLLDGFDELDQVIVKDVSLEIENLVRKYPELKLIVSSRPGHEIQKSTSLQILPIAPLAESEYSAFLDRLKVDSKKSLALRQAIKSSPSKISTLITTPLMLTLVVLVYESDSEIPDTLPEFFEGLFQVVFTRHDRQKAHFNRRHHCGLSERKLQQLFEAFSFMTIQLGYTRTISHKQFEEIFENALAYTENTKCELEDFKQDMTKVACLMLEDGSDSISYLHKSILEYYAAAFVRRLDDESANLFYNRILDNPKIWNDVLVFLKSIDGVRHARFYVLPVIADHKKCIITPSREANDGQLALLIRNLYPELGVYYKQQDGGNYHRGAVGDLFSRAGEEIGGFGFLVMDILFKESPEEVSNLEETYGCLPIAVDKVFGVHVPAIMFFRNFGVAKLKESIGVFETRLIRAETEAKAIIAGEEKKKLIFALPVKRSVVQPARD